MQISGVVREHEDGEQPSALARRPQQPALQTALERMNVVASHVNSCLPRGLEHKAAAILDVLVKDAPNAVKAAAVEVLICGFENLHVRSATGDMIALKLVDINLKENVVHLKFDNDFAAFVGKDEKVAMTELECAIAKKFAMCGVKRDDVQCCELYEGSINFGLAAAFFNFVSLFVEGSYGEIMCKVGAACWLMAELKAALG